MATGWVYRKGNWYYLDEETGAMKQNEWFRDLKAEEELPIGKKRQLRYWFDEDGVMATGCKEIDGQWEMFAENGEWLYTWDGN